MSTSLSLEVSAFHSQLSTKGMWHWMLFAFLFGFIGVITGPKILSTFASEK